MKKRTCDKCNGNVIIVYINDEYYYECTYCGSVTDEDGEPIGV